MENNTDIRAIIFDLGNVILDIYPERSGEEFHNLGLVDFQKYYTIVAQTDLFDNLETGKITDNEFYDKLRKITKLDFKNKQIENAWNRIIGKYPKINISVLMSLKGKIPIYLLSNTNAIHYKVYTKILQDDFGIDGLEAIFNKCYFSHKVGLRKPDSEIYGYVTKDLNIETDKILFLDDCESNIDAAKAYGWNTILYKSNNIAEALNTYGIEY